MSVVGWPGCPSWWTCPRPWSPGTTRRLWTALRTKHKHERVGFLQQSNILQDRIHELHHCYYSTLLLLWRHRSTWTGFKQPVQNRCEPPSFSWSFLLTGVSGVVDGSVCLDEDVPRVEGHHHHPLLRVKAREHHLQIHKLVRRVITIQVLRGKLGRNDKYQTLHFSLQ